jgi:hypothetical protein
MVSSRLSPAISYEEDLTVSSEDSQHESYVYQIREFDKDLFFVVGKPNYTLSKKNITTYSVYIVCNITYNIVARIGLFEIRINDNLNVFDSKGEIMIDKLGEPLFYEVLEQLMNDLEVSQKEYMISHKKEEPRKEEKKTEPEPEKDVKIGNEYGDIDNMLDLIIPSESMSKVKVDIDTKLDNGIFTIKEINRRQLPIETKEMADIIAKSYKKLSSHNWIKVIMQNTNYEIHQTNDNGDCFFQVIQDAFKQIGHYTTIPILRAVVAKNTTEATFIGNREMYLGFLNEIQLIEKEMYHLKHVIEIDNKQKGSMKGITQEELRNVLNDTLLSQNRFNECQEGIDETKAMISEIFGEHFGPITTIDKYREFILTSRYWAEASAIAILEKELNIKFIILSELFSSDQTNILQCGETLESTQEIGYFKPDYYIITTYSGKHYELVSYKTNKILTFSEVPYHLKTITIKKCMAGIGGIYTLIDDYKNLQVELGINNDNNNNNVNIDDNVDLYDSSVLMFYSNSANAKPGRGAGDIISKDRYSSFIELTKIRDWRRKLDDSWLDVENPFIINGNSYASVIHYYQGSKFRNGYPDFANEFSLNSKSEMSMDINLCKIAVSNPKLKLKNIKVDDGFFSNHRNLEEIDLAIHAKFSQNEELKKILINTNKAKLIHYIGAKEPEVVINLMKLRLKLNSVEHIIK